MDLNTGAFLFSILLSAAAAITSDYRRQFWLAYFFRPFTIMLMIGLIYEIRPASFYRNAVLVGLIFCLLGEMMMLLKKKNFLAGLLFFLMAQIALAVAFYSRLKPGFLTWPAILLSLFAGFILFLIWPRLSTLRWPVLIYFLAILTMTRLALELPHQHPGISSWLAAAGALLFFISDALIGLNNFFRKWVRAQIFILLFFYSGLLLITLSV
ncbi:MAG: lysoplasmalogenase [Candidatus Saccharicenans sp.]|nr:MAG: hypothetical protein C0168_09220 [Candidatus Aminicenantes bacterium]HEK86492.1 lysoplasmalogenase [Candidatus Aminicenantes bacterium]